LKRKTRRLPRNDFAQKNRLAHFLRRARSSRKPDFMPLPGVPHFFCKFIRAFFDFPVDAGREV
jgi:hypothetical protein